ncbi:archaellin/type IV pilin N-terminal domain-containing protein [Methanocaldococcus jannaschii]|nr:archaellin/type IV pilin N-terminal domain-containing protein [Methanocaldococcus jannaschii]
MMDWLKNKKAISPILALLIVLGVTIVVGAVFYAWGSNLFGNSQEKTQAAVEGTATNMFYDAGAIRVAATCIDKIRYQDADDSDSWLGYPNGNGKIAKPSTSNGCYNSTYGTVFYDERFIVEIPVTIDTQDYKLTGVKVVGGIPKIVDMGGTYTNAFEDISAKFYAFWLHLNDNYQLLKKDGTLFVGYVNKSGMFEVSNGYVIAWNQTRDTYGKLASSVGATSDSSWDAVNTTTGVAPLVETSWPYYGTYCSNVKLYTATGEELKPGFGSGTLVAQWFCSSATYLDKLFNNPEYVVGTLPKNSEKTVKTYLFFNTLYLPNYKGSTNDGYVTFEVPLKVVSNEGVTKEVKVKFTVYDDE